MKLNRPAWLIIILMIAIHVTMYFIQNPAVRIAEFEGHTALIGRLDLPWGTLLVGFVLIALAAYGMVLNREGKDPRSKAKKVSLSDEDD